MSINEIKIQYNESIDLLRGFAIFLVVWGHLIESSSILYRYINNLHLPLFFIISGFLLGRSLSNHSRGIILKKKFYRLYIPFLSWSFIAFASKALFAIIHKHFSYESFYEMFYSVFIQAKSVWFLEILFWGSCLIIFYSKISDNKIGKMFFIILILCIYIFLPNDIMSLGKLKVMFPVFFFGFWIYNKNLYSLFLTSYFKRFGIFLGVTFACLLYFLYDYEMYVRFTEFDISILEIGILWYLYFTVIQLLGIFFSIYIILPLLKKIHLFKIIGKYSLDIYVQHMFFINYIIKIFSNHFTTILFEELFIILCAVLITLFCTFISKNILHKIRIYRLFMIGEIELS